jgi:hypothetical protein
MSHVPATLKNVLEGDICSNFSGLHTCIVLKKIQVNR